MNTYARVRKEKNREVNVPMPRFYFFFAGAFFTSFLTGFFATNNPRDFIYDSNLYL
jgi:hypothetical protein